MISTRIGVLDVDAHLGEVGVVEERLDHDPRLVDHQLLVARRLPSAGDGRRAPQWRRGAEKRAARPIDHVLLTSRSSPGAPGPKRGANLAASHRGVKEARSLPGRDRAIALLQRSMPPAILCDRTAGTRSGGTMRARAERKVTAAARRPSGLAEAPAVAPARWHPEAAIDDVASAAAARGPQMARAAGYEGDPYANPIALLALDLLQRMDADELDEQAAEALIQRLTREAFAGRAAAAARLSRRARPGAQSRHDPPPARRPGAGTRTERSVPFATSPRGWSASTTASCSPPIRPSAGPWSCRPCWPRAAFGLPRRRDPRAAQGSWHGPSSVAHRPPAQARPRGGARPVAARHRPGARRSSAHVYEHRASTSRASSIRTNGAGFGRGC